MTVLSTLCVCCRYSLWVFLVFSFIFYVFWLRNDINKGEKVVNLDSKREANESDKLVWGECIEQAVNQRKKSIEKYTDEYIYMVSVHTSST